MPQEEQSAAIEESKQNQEPPQEGTTDSTAGNEGGEKPNAEMSPEDTAQALEAARREAARYRTERNELRKKQEEAAKANQTDSERIAALEKAAQDATRRADLATVAQTSGIDAKFIQGDDVESMQSYAEELNAYIESRIEAALKDQKTMPVVSGENAGGEPLEGADWLRKMFARP